MIYERIASKIAKLIDFDGQDFQRFTNEIIDISEDISISFSGVAYHGGNFEMTEINLDELTICGEDWDNQLEAEDLIEIEKLIQIWY